MLSDKLNKKLIKIEKDRNQLIDLVESYKSRFNQIKDSEKWTIAQVFQHLILSEAGTIQYISKRIDSINDLPTSGIKNWYKSNILSIALKSSAKFKAPKILPDPSNKYSFDETIDQWNLVRLELKSIFESIPSDKLNTEIFKHPYFGKLNAFQTLNFTENHLRHHIKQVKRIISI